MALLDELIEFSGSLSDIERAKFFVLYCEDDVEVLYSKKIRKIYSEAKKKAKGNWAERVKYYTNSNGMMFKVDFEDKKKKIEIV